MSEVKWTDEQLMAIKQEGSNLLVAAAAGSGKTAVLVNRIIEKILNKNINIDELLIVTFTNAAASEMRGRILTAIYNKIDENPENLHLKRQVILLSRANIKTIHSFCLDVIRSNFYTIDLDPNFKIGQESEIEILKLESMEELFETKYEEENKQFITLLNTFTTYKSDEALRELILKLYNHIICLPYPNKWLEEKIEMYNINIEQNFFDTVWGKILREEISVQIKDDISKLKILHKELLEDLDLVKYQEVIMSDINEMQSLYNIILENSWDKTYEKVNNIEFMRLSATKKGSEELKEKAKKTRNEIKTKIKDVKENIFVCKSEDANKDIKTMHEVLTNLKELVIEFWDIFSKNKRDKNIIDFNDIEQYALKVLLKEDEEGNFVPTKVANEYREKFSEVLIDEYQDSNLVQEYILNSISKRKQHIHGR